MNQELTRFDNRIRGVTLVRVHPTGVWDEGC
jgi:hypothetical protein